MACPLQEKSHTHRHRCNIVLPSEQKAEERPLAVNDASNRDLPAEASECTIKPLQRNKPLRGKPPFGSTAAPCKLLESSATQHRAWQGTCSS